MGAKVDLADELALRSATTTLSDPAITFFGQIMHDNREYKVYALAEDGLSEYYRIPTSGMNLQPQRLFHERTGQWLDERRIGLPSSISQTLTSMKNALPLPDAPPPDPDGAPKGSSHAGRQKRRPRFVPQPSPDPPHVEPLEPAPHASILYSPERGLPLLRELAHEFSRASERYERAQNPILKDIKDMLMYLEGKPSLASVAKEFTNDLMKLKDEFAFDQSEPLNLYGLGKSDLHQLELLISLQHRRGNMYRGLEGIFYDHCVDTLSKLGDVHSKIYEDLVVFRVHPHTSRYLNALTHQLQHLPPALQAAQSRLALQIYFEPSNTVYSHDTTQKHSSSGRKKASEVVRDFITKRKNATIQETQEITKLSYGTVYNVYSALVNQNELLATRDGKALRYTLPDRRSRNGSALRK